MSPRSILVNARKSAPSSQLTLRWRKMDSNSRSHREAKGYGEPLQASIAASDLNLQVAPPFMSLSPIGNAQNGLSQERN